MIRHNRVRIPAPSMRAASSSSIGTASNAVFISRMPTASANSGIVIAQ